jgi:hypothetical protein
MTNELNKWLALYIMKYIPIVDALGTKGYKYKNEDGKWDMISERDWTPIESRDQMARCEEKIPKGISELKYYHALVEICLDRKFQFVDTIHLHWTEGLIIAKASPLQRAEALYKTMEG